MSELKEISKLKLTEIQTELKKRNLTSTGKKSDLAQKLAEAIKEEKLLKDDEDDVDEEVIKKPTKQPSPVAVSKVDNPPSEKKAPQNLEDAVAKRVERFGIQSPDVAKKLRAERFGLPVSANGASTLTANVDCDKLKSRADRFGDVISPILKKETNKLNLDKRAKRFGPDTSAADELKEKRAKRFLQT